MRKTGEEDPASWHHEEENFGRGRKLGVLLGSVVLCVCVSGCQSPSSKGFQESSKGYSMKCGSQTIGISGMIRNAGSLAPIELETLWMRLGNLFWNRPSQDGGCRGPRDQLM